MSTRLLTSLVAVIAFDSHEQFDMSLSVSAEYAADRQRQREQEERVRRVEDLRRRLVQEETEQLQQEEERRGD